MGILHGSISHKAEISSLRFFYFTNKMEINVKTLYVIHVHIFNVLIFSYTAFIRLLWASSITMVKLNNGVEQCYSNGGSIPTWWFAT